jgi:hypothetical protein
LTSAPEPCTNPRERKVDRAPITYVAAQLGHRKPTTTLMFYAHWIPGGDKSHIDRLAAARLAVEPKVPPTLLDETGVPKEWHRSGAISKSVEVSGTEVSEKIGSPGWARTSDFLINRRGPAPSRPSVFLQSSA